MDMVVALTYECPVQLRVLKASALHESDTSALQRSICFVLSALLVYEGRRSLKAIKGVVAASVFARNRVIVAIKDTLSCGLQASEKAARAVTKGGDAALPGRKSMAADVAAADAAKAQKRSQKKARKDGVSADAGKCSCHAPLHLYIPASHSKGSLTGRDKVLHVH